MSGFADIIGHSDAVKYLENAVLQNKVSHAYIIQGAAGTGKRMMADAFAQSLLCDHSSESLDGDACGACRSCHQVRTRNHPDVVYVTHEKESVVSVEEIRQQLVADVSIKPYYGKYKVYIVADAEKMSAGAQNALLKTLEEPPAYVVILLLTVNASVFLDTIRSRCVMVDLHPVPDELITAYLMEHQQLPDYQAKLCAAFAQGSIGKAVLLGSSQQFSQIRELAAEVVSHAGDLDITELTGLVKKAAEYKVEIDDLLDILAVWYRDVLYFKATRNADQLVFPDQLQQIRGCAQRCSYEGIEKILQALTKAKVRLNANVTFDLVMELLFLTIKENS